MATGDNVITEWEDGEILSFCHTPDGLTQLSFFGVPGKIYSLYSSTELEPDSWNIVANDIPLSNGIGEWGAQAALPKRFFQVRSRDRGIVDPDDPPPIDPPGTGGSTSRSLGSGLGVQSGSPGELTQLPGERETDAVRLIFNVDSRFVNSISSVELFHNGQFLTIMDGGAGQFHHRILPEHYPEGAHRFYAVAYMDFETTVSSADTVTLLESHGVRRTDPITFDSPSEGLKFHATSLDNSFKSEGGARPTEFMASVSDTTSFTELCIYNWRGDLVYTEDFEIPEGNPDNPQPYNFTPSWSAPQEFGEYSCTLKFFGPADGESQPVRVMAGRAAENTALALYENNFSLPAEAYDDESAFAQAYYPAWAKEPRVDDPALSDFREELGPYGELKSILPMYQTLKRSLQEVGYDVRCQSPTSVTCNRDRPDEDAFDLFESGVNPFNSYDLGFLIGHGRAVHAQSAIGEAVPAQRATHLMPLRIDRETGDTLWYSATDLPEDQRFGASGKLKWMLMLTCNALSNDAVRTNVTGEGNPGLMSYFNYARANNLLPIGENLEVFGGYATYIFLEQELGQRLGEELKGGKSVVQTYLDTCNTRGNAARQFRSRAVWREECEGNTLDGVINERRVSPMGAMPAHSELRTDDRVAD